MKVTQQNSSDGVTGVSEVFVSFCSSFLPTVFDRGVSGYVRLSVLWGLTDFLWSGGMCESWKTLAERTADQNTLGLLGLEREDDDIGGEGLVFEGRHILSSHVYCSVSLYLLIYFRALNVLRLSVAETALCIVKSCVSISVLKSWRIFRLPASVLLQRLGSRQQ